MTAVAFRTLMARNYFSSYLHLHIQIDRRLKHNKNENAELWLISVNLVMNTVYKKNQ